MKRLLSSLAAASSLAFTPVFGAELNDAELDKFVGGTMSSGTLAFQKQEQFGVFNAQNQSAGGGGTQQAASGIGIVQVGDDVNVLNGNKIASGNDVDVLSHNKGNTTQVQVLGNKQVAYTKTYTKKY